MNKKIILLSAFALISTVASYAVKVKLIGDINMISTRNIEVENFGKYQLITTYSGGSSKEFKKSRSETIQEAIDNTVRNVPGGVYILNAKVYLIDNRYYAVEGDVYGIKTNAGYRGFAVGSKVMWVRKKHVAANKEYMKGEVLSIKNSDECIIKVDETGEMLTKKFIDLSKAE